MSTTTPPLAPLSRKPLRRLVRFSVVCALVLAFSLVVCKRLIGWVYPVASGSMEPTIMTGEWVFLRYDRHYDRAVPKRFEIVAFTDKAGGASIKRVFGLPGDKFRIDASGDVRIDGRNLAPDAPGRPGMIPMFDSRLQSIGDHWNHGSGEVDPWSLVESDGGGAASGVDEVWEMDGSAIGRGVNLGFLRLHAQIDDGRLLPDGTRVAGLHTVHDVAVSFEIMVVEAGGSVKAQITEQGDVFQVRIPVYEGEDEAHIYIYRGFQPLKIEILDVGRTPVPLGTWISVRFENVDNRLTFDFGDVHMSVPYDRNTPHPTAYDLVPKSPGERVRIGGEGVVLRVRNIRVERDFHIVPRGKYGVEHESFLSDDEIFVLGDASRHSRDSRDRDAVPTERVFGRAKAVVWPLKNARILR